MAFECQLFDEIPIADHDIFMDRIITEDHICHGLSRSSWTEEKDPRRCALIDKSLLGDLTVVEQHELSQLQQQAEAHFDEVASPSIDGALKLHAHLLKLSGTTNK